MSYRLLHIERPARRGQGGWGPEHRLDQGTPVALLYAPPRLHRDRDHLRLDQEIATAPPAGDQPLTHQPANPLNRTLHQLRGYLNRNVVNIVQIRTIFIANVPEPSTIARKVGVGYATVARIADTTKRLQRAGTGADPAIISTNGSERVTI